MTVYSKPLINQQISEKHRGMLLENEMLDSFYEAMSINELIQEAERLKMNKRYGKSAQVLQIAQGKMYEKKERKLDLLLKLPMYLQLAGQEYSGWMEFFEIKSRFYGYENAGLITHAEMLYYESKISHVMSLFQERKREIGSSIYYTIRSYLESLASLQHIIRVTEARLEKATNPAVSLDLEVILAQAKSYLSIKQAPFQYISMLANILVQLGRIEILEDLNKLIQLTMMDLPLIDWHQLEESINDILIVEAI